MKTILSILMLLLLSASGCRKENPGGPGDPKQLTLPPKSEMVIAQGNGFGINLFREVALQEDGNMMLSPLSASVALSMLLNGSETATYEQIRDMLGFQGLTLEEINTVYLSLTSQLLNLDPKTTLTLANAVWYRNDFTVKPPFLDRMDKVFSAETGALDFLSPEALTTINGWARDNTNGKIDKVLEEISSDAVMFLMNALYFKGDWTYRFNASKTADMPFHPVPGESVIVPTMTGNFPVRVTYGEGYTAMELPYGQQNFAMVVIMPSGSLSTWLSGFDAGMWESITDALDKTPAGSKDVYLPKFKFDYEKVLNNQLKALGMTDAFSPMLADLSGISDQQIFVSFVKQNTFVDVNEQGTEAAAVTTIGVELTSLPEPVTINKPFIFAIRERTTNTLLFTGKVELPEY